MQSQLLRAFLVLSIAPWHLLVPRVRADEAAAHMAAAAQNFLATLDPDQRSKAVFEFKADERFNWHFIPRTRKGLPWKDMTAGQRQLGHGLLGAALSHRGYFKATTIMSLEEVLHELEKNNTGNRIVRDSANYYISIFGSPDPKGTWGWRFEGHHLALNFTLVGGTVAAATPSFLGSNPAEVRQGPRQGLRTLAAEEDLGRALVLSLDDTQRRAAIYTNVAPADIVTSADRTARLLKPDGLSMARMTPAQSELLVRLIHEYVDRNRPEVATADFRKLMTPGPEHIFFSWAGPVEPGKGHYYRVQGPTFLLEYDNTQNNANHVHAVWRDLGNDFGDDTLRRHYEEQHR